MNVNSCIPYSWTWCPASRGHAPAFRLVPSLEGFTRNSGMPMPRFHLILWTHNSGVHAKSAVSRGSTDSPLFSRLNILSDAERERCRNGGRGIYTMKREVIYVCRDADLGNRIAAPRPPVDKRYILIERRTKWEEWIETIRDCAHRALFKTPDLRERRENERKSNAARGRGTRARETNVGIEEGNDRAEFHGIRAPRLSSSRLSFTEYEIPPVSPSSHPSPFPGRLMSTFNGFIQLPPAAPIILLPTLSQPLRIRSQFLRR